ncbi:hypothetical protein FQN54_006082 [Arachnomyces sp. PD_36]|nr:hypothetical protein FQN54_006082 [Arachnomyces sp. PD_36]
MVFKPFTHLARQSFAKTFTHGYAQSVVAASQSSYASSTSSLNQLTSHHPGKFKRTTQLQNAFRDPSGSSGAGARAGQTASGNAQGDSGLAAYYAAWQYAQQTGDEGDWTQFQFTKRIGWKPTSQEPNEQNADSEAAGAAESADVAGRRSPGSTDSFDARRVETAAVDADVISKVDEAVAREIRQIQGEEEEPNSVTLTDVSSVADSGKSVESRASEITKDSSVNDTEPFPELPDWDAKSVVAEQPVDQWDHVVQLAVTEKYAEIPAVFENLLKSGLTPKVGAYNALLAAAIRLHVDTHHAVPKALDVYSDMLRRGVMPDEVTYKSLIQLLSTRSLETLRSKRTLEQQRQRFGGMEEPGKFILQSSEVEHELLSEDHSLPIAIKLFTTAISRHADILFPLDVYCSLVTTCAEQGRVDDMIQIFAHMETNKTVPHAVMFPSMIKAFAKSGDLQSAVECYNEYKALAIADDSGVFAVVERKDGEVYAALVKAYLSCGKEKGGLSFFDKIHSSFGETIEDREARWQSVESTIVDGAIVQHSLDQGNFQEAFNIAETRLSKKSLESSMMKICVAAADAGNTAIASQAYQRLSEGSVSLDAPLAMLALHVRNGDVSAARPFWATITPTTRVTRDMIQPTTMYTAALLKSGQIEEGLMEARDMFARIRKGANKSSQSVVREEVDEAIELLGRIAVQSGTVLSSQSAMSLLWAMVENSGLIGPLAEHAIVSLGPMDISQMNAADLTLALKVQARMVLTSANLTDAAHPARFAHMVEIAVASGMPLDEPTTGLIDQAVTKLGDSLPELTKRWQHYLQPARKQAYVPARYPASSEASVAGRSTPSEDTFDPYAHATDYRGSAIIADELERNSGRAETHLNEALIKFKNMRRVGRHPRYITYAKLITAAAKCGRMNLIHDILAMARQDVPLLPQHNVVKYGWVSILDSMVAACLTLGDRGQAAKFHQELLNMDAAPSANTFGLYITTLKESTKTFDEATEAVKIFHRATSEGVEPTSFLYNALIGKLGKARRIDDCLLYFAEMRANGVRPTSVTYGTIVNALCRVSDERFAEEMFDEMESMPNYKPRPAPYNSLIQYFLNTKRDRSKVLAYYERMQSKNIRPTMHTYKLLIDAYASLEPVNMDAAEKIIDTIRSTGQHPEAVQFASLIHAKGCVMHDMEGARKVFDSVIADPNVRAQPCLYQALFEAMVANHQVSATASVLKDMASRRVEMTPYIANTLIHGWAAEGNIANAKSVYDGIGMHKREPSTYEAMTRAFLASEDHQSASKVVQEMMSRGYPSAVAGKIIELVGGGNPASSMA